MARLELQRCNRLHGGVRDASLGTLVDAFAKKVEPFQWHGRLAVVGRSASDLVAAAGWLASSGTDGMVVSAASLTSELETHILGQGYAVADLDATVLKTPSATVPGERGRISIVTSGTTGAPAIIQHSWDTLFTMTRVRGRPGENWLVTYQPGTYAWWQMVTMALFLPQQSITVADAISPTPLMQAALNHAVTAISATPTFWRMVLLHFSPEQLRGLPLRHVTLGGEPVDQVILDRLRAHFPDISLTHIYASSELGAAIIVHDEREGFPADWLTTEAPPASSESTPRLLIRDGILWINSPFSAQPGWHSTGDLCEIRGGRAIVVGRNDRGFISVGGAKVPAHEVERVLLTHPALLWCRVSGRKAPLVGELVSADIVFTSPEKKVAERDLSRYCAERLPEHMVPRFWNVMADIPVTSNIKTPAH